MTLRSIIIQLAAMALCVSNCPAAEGMLTQDEALSLFRQANEAFTRATAQKDATRSEAEFDRAILLFERLIQEGDIQNAKLYYNLANAYLMNGQDVPIFTAIRSSVRHAGRLCAEMLLDIVTEPGQPARHKLLEADLVVGRRRPRRIIPLHLR